MALDRGQVVTTALRLMDEVGLEGLSLRRLAKELGVQAPALYWHFENKQQLLEEMAETMTVLDIPPPRPLAPGEAWQEWLRGRARSARAALVRRRDGALLAASTKPRATRFAQIELQLRELVAVGFSAPDAADALLVIGNFVAGSALEEQGEIRQPGRPGQLTAAQVDEMFVTIAQYPILAGLFRDHRDPPHGTTFEYGLDVIVAGLEARLARSRPAG